MRSIHTHDIIFVGGHARRWMCELTLLAATIFLDRSTFIYLFILVNEWMNKWIIIHSFILKMQGHVWMGATGGNDTPWRIHDWLIFLLLLLTHSTWYKQMRYSYGVATISRLLKIIGLLCKRALWKRRYSAKETYNFKEPNNRSHPIAKTLSTGPRLIDFWFFYYDYIRHTRTR